MVSLLQRVTFEKRESNQSAFAPFVRCLVEARHALAPVLLRGPAAIGHPWPGAANPASMPGCPLRRTSTRPLEGANTATEPRGGLIADLVVRWVAFSCWKRFAGEISSCRRDLKFLAGAGRWKKQSPETRKPRDDRGFFWST